MGTISWGDAPGWYEFAPLALNVGMQGLDPSGFGLRNAHFFPNAAFLFPIVERLAVDLVNGSFCDSHAARLSGHEEINVIDCAVGSFHVDTSEIFAVAQTGEPANISLVST